MNDTRPRISGRNRHALEWFQGMLVLIVLVLLGAVIYLAVLVGNLEAQTDRFIQIEKDTKFILEQHAEKAGEHVDRAKDEHLRQQETNCRILRSTSPGEPCAVQER